MLFHTAELKNPRFLLGSALSKPFSDPPGLPEAKHRTKMLYEITRQKLLRDRCGPEAHKDASSVTGLGALAPLEIRPPSLVRLSLAVAERVGEDLDIIECRKQNPTFTVGKLP